MKTLAVDCGNTRIKWAPIESGRLAARPVVFAIADAAAWRALRAAGAAAKGAARVANVAPAARARLQKALGEKAIFLRAPKRGGGMSSRYRPPESLGIDRWCAALAAREIADGKDAVAVCAGTALTIDWIDAAGVFRGGLILPGFETAARALAAATGLPLVAASSRAARGLSRPPTDTAAAVTSGWRFAAAAAVGAFAARFAPEAVWVLGGGDARALRAFLPSRIEGEIVMRPHLTLEGIALAVGED